MAMGPFPHYYSCYNGKSKESEVCYLHVVIDISQNLLYEGGTFKVELFLIEYLIREPEAYFVVKIYHLIACQVRKKKRGYLKARHPPQLQICRLL